MNEGRALRKRFEEGGDGHAKMIQVMDARIEEGKARLELLGRENEIDYLRELRGRMREAGCDDY